MKLTLGDIKGPISKVLGMASTDSRVVDYINEAQQRLMHQGSWAGTYARYRITTDDGMITWPRQLQTIEAVAIDDKPGTVRNRWFEFLETGPGVLDSNDSIGGQLIDQDVACSFSDISGTGKRIRVYTDSLTASVDTGTKVLLQGYDDNGNWIRTQDGSNYVDGEYVTMTESYAETTNNFSSLSGVQKPDTKGNVTLKEYNVSADSVRTIAEYEPLENLPTYRRSMIPSITTSATVTITGKLRFIPAENDIDWLLISSQPALKLMVMAIRKEENNIMDEAMVYEAKAVKTLQDQLMHHLGDGAVFVPRIEGAETWGGGVVNMN
tara:strand:- start:3389 stop:4357 length:969 start_codon:yes stop_codon:yes gene_type:complete